MAAALEALDSARTYLNDVKAQIWTNEALLPYLKEAHRDLQLVLWLNGLPVLREQAAAITIPAGAKNLGANQPLDLLEPISLQERAVGLPDWDFMVEKDFAPDIEQETTLRYWAWREEILEFVGATTDREVLLRYWKGLATPTSENSLLGFILAEAFCGPQTAQYAARAVGNTTLASEALDTAREKIDMILRANIKGGQSLMARRIPYRRLARSRLRVY